MRARTFRVVLVSKSHPTGFSFKPTEFKTVKYTGLAVRLALK
jgi:hypothetical protein